MERELNSSSWGVGAKASVSHGLPGSAVIINKAARSPGGNNKGARKWGSYITQQLL